MEAGAPYVEAVDLARSFGAVSAVDGISLTVASGQAYALVGPDGAGKTTTMRLLVGALTPDRGRVRILGHDMAVNPEGARAHVGYLAQRFSLYGDLTVAENLRFFGRVKGVGPDQVAARSAELLGFTGLAGFELRRAERLSGGMKQKLGLACALIHSPRVLFLDEPTGGLDPLTRQDLWQLLYRVLGQGTAVVVTTPYMDEAARCHHLAFMLEGRILVQAAPARLTEPLRGRVLELAATPRRLAKETAAADPEVVDVLAFGDHFHLHVLPGADTITRLPGALAAAGVALERFEEVDPSLEDAFLTLLRQANTR